SPLIEDRDAASATQKCEAAAASGAWGRQRRRLCLSRIAATAGANSMRTALRGKLAGFAAAACLCVMAAPPAAAQQIQRFEEKTAERLAELQIDSSQVQSIRYVVKRKVDDRAGPEIEGVESYVRL